MNINSNDDKYHHQNIQEYILSLSIRIYCSSHNRYKLSILNIIAPKLSYLKWGMKTDDLSMMINHLIVISFL